MSTRLDHHGDHKQARKEPPLSGGNTPATLAFQSSKPVWSRPALRSNALTTPVFGDSTQSYYKFGLPLAEQYPNRSRWKGGIGAFCPGDICGNCHCRSARVYRVDNLPATCQPRTNVTVLHGPLRSVGVVALHPKPSKAGTQRGRLPKANQINLRGVTVAGGAAVNPRYRVSGSQNGRREKISRRHTLSMGNVALAPLLVPT